MAVLMVMVMLVMMLVLMMVVVLVVVIMLVMMVVLMVVVMSMMMTLVEILFIHAANSDRKMAAGYAAFYRGLTLILNLGDSKSVELIYEFIGFGQKFQQSSGQHIAGSAHGAIEI